jgi:hypothetical protein
MTTDGGFIEGVDNTGFGSYQNLYIGGLNLTFQLSGSDAMVLTGTGLGIGTSSPSGQLSLGTNGSTQVGSQILLYDAGSASNANNYGLAVNASTGEFSASAGTSGYFTFYTLNRTERMRLDSSGNLGLGVTPSAWGSILKPIQLGNAFSYVAGRTDGVRQVWLGSNSYFDGTNWIYGLSSPAAQYYQNDGSHIWNTSTDVTPTAGNPISFTQVMTLDASGQLGIGTTSPTAPFTLVQAANFPFIHWSDASNTIIAFAGWHGGGGGGDDFRIGTQGAKALTLQTNNTERARIPAAGGMVVGPAALATSATDGFLYVPTCAGTPTGTPTTQTGTAPIVVDTTNNKLYFYSGGQWRDAGP